MDKKQEILYAAYTLFCQKGEHLSMADLAEAVGIKTPSLYSHYAGKEEILTRMIEEEIRQYEESLQQLVERLGDLSSYEALKSFFFSILAYYQTENRLRFWRMLPLLQSVALKETFAGAIGETDRRNFAQILQLLIRGKETGEVRIRDAESSLHLYFSMIQGILEAMLLYPERAEDLAFAERIFEAYWAGIRA